MYISVEDIKNAAALTTAIIGLLGIVFSAYKWYLKQNKQDKDIKAMKDEQCLLCYAQIACLDGLEQLGANGNVSKAKDKLEKHMNQKAHE